MQPVKIVARYVDGRIVKGHTYDFSAEGSRFHVVPPAGDPSQSVEVAVRDLKALFFVRDFQGNPDYEPRKPSETERHAGRRVEVVFADGEVLAGYTMGYDRERPGFFVYPADPNGNNLRVYVVSAAVTLVRTPSEPEPQVEPLRTREPSPLLTQDLLARVRASGQALRQAVSDWEALMGSVEEIGREQASLQGQRAQMEREIRDLRATLERLRPEYEETVRTLAGLRSAHESLSREHEAAHRGLRELRAQLDEAVRERRNAVGTLETILHRLQAPPAAEVAPPSGSG